MVSTMAKDIMIILYGIKTINIMRCYTSEDPITQITW